MTYDDSKAIIRTCGHILTLAYVVGAGQSDVKETADLVVSDLELISEASGKLPRMFLTMTCVRVQEILRNGA